MTAEPLRGYVFRTDAQWSAGLFVQADRSVSRGMGGLRPFAPYAQPPERHAGSDAHAPAITPTGEVVWLGAASSMHRLPADDDEARVVSAPFATTDVFRVIPTSSGLWVTGDPPESIRLYEEDSLARLLTIEVHGQRPLDIAADGHDVLALIRRGDAWEVVRIGCGGRDLGAVTLETLVQPSGFTFLSRSRRFVVLTAERHPRLRWFSAEGHPLLSMVVGALRPCFVAHVLGSDTRDRVVLAGADGQEFGGGWHLLIYDADGNRLGDVPLDAEDAPVTGLAATRDSLVVTGRRGLLRFRAGDVVPDGAEDVTSTFITPMLFSPDREDQRRWLRIDATASLPEGATLELAFGATDDPAIRDGLTRIAEDASLTASQRVRALLEEPDLWRAPTVVHGTGAEAGQSPASFSAPLFDVRERYLWARVTVVAAPGARLPAVSELVVRYPGRSLMEELPAIYRRGEMEPGNVLRALVGVLETTTQGMDARIAALGSHVHPATASGPWQDFVARWLGVPWDDGLAIDQKRAILRRAADLAKARGTRAGLEMLLESLMPGEPRRFRVTDSTADVGFAMVGDSTCLGSALPAMLGGRPRWTAELDSGAVLGAMRLPCDGQVDDGTSQLTGRIRVEVAATAGERQAWEPWLLAVIGEMVPLTARLDLRWVSPHALRTTRLDGTLTLDPAPAPQLGTDAITGLARLPERRSRLSAWGPTIGARLG